MVGTVGYCSGYNGWFGVLLLDTPSRAMIVTILEVIVKELKGDLRGHFSKDVTQLKMCLNRVDLDLVLNDLLVKPNAARSKLRRWSSCKKQSTRVVLMDGDMHMQESASGLSSGFFISMATPISSTRAMIGNRTWQQFPKAMISASIAEVVISVCCLDDQ